MILHPPVIALVGGSVVISGMLLYSSAHGLRIVRRWDIRSGSELQLNLERRTYLISTIVSYAFVFQILSLFLFVYTADDLCSLFTGAMCAAGTLFVNEFGYPALLMKLLNFFLAGFWLILNSADTKAPDYPLIRTKYTALMGITPLVLCEAALQAAYFGGMQPNVITSCCGSLFSGEQGIGRELFAMDYRWAGLSLYAVLSLAIVTGSVFVLRQKGGSILAILSAACFLVSISAIISFVSPYIYELPTHRCPFCILQAEYHYVGYPIYAALLGATLSGLGVGLLGIFRKRPSLEGIIPGIRKNLAIAAVAGYALFAAIVLYVVAASNLRME